MLSILIENMGLLCSKNRRYNAADSEENAQTAEIERRIEQETKAEKHIQKLLLLGAGESGKSTIFKQIKLLFQTGFDEAELKSYISVIHANVYQTIKVLYDGSKELAQNETDSMKFVVSSENKEIGEKLSEIGGRLDYPRLTKELAEDIETLWADPAIQETYAHGNELQLPDCANYFVENLQRLSDANYVPTKDDVLYARVRTTGVVEIQFSPVGEHKKSGEVYRLFDVGGQRNERRKWIHLFEGVSAVIFCAAISEYDQTLFEDEQKNRMMETKELFDWAMTREWKLLPKSRERPVTRFYPDGEATLVGLACDLAKNKYNVVLAGYHRAFGHRPDGTFKCLVFDSESNRWRKFVSVQDYYQFSIMNRNQVVFVNGALHWLTDSCSFILALDLEVDVWRKISLPDKVGSESRSYLLECDGCLSVIEISDEWMETWVLKDYYRDEWHSVDKVSLRCIKGMVPSIFPISQTREYVFLATHKQVLVYHRNGRLWKEMYSVKYGSTLPLWFSAHAFRSTILSCN